MIVDINLRAYLSHMRAARRERNNGCHLNAAAWVATATVYANLWIRSRRVA